ncbi:alginate O-acetyltransferase AlgX-related protein [Clostridium thermarum]|uniref:alginate O-acetyltransferase AlgX-related protein n=1 Tax=Clostridium thermarum TaxID=1716543 RepID=UPI00111F2CBE|nr:hypothetical protein [Clostridium thermarum]
MRENIRKNLFKKLYIAAFCVIIALPLFQMNTQLFKADILNEKRVKAQKPVFDIKQPLAKFTQTYETYYNDNFGFRDHLIRLSNTIDVNLFKKSTHEKVHMGTNDYLFHGDEMADYHRTNLLKDEDIELIANKLRVFQDNLTREGIDFIFYVAPNKSTIYPEFVGIPQKNPNAESNYERLMKALEHKNINTLDAKKVLIENKDKYSLYYKRDTHWNDIAAALVANEFMSKYAAKYNFEGNLSIETVSTKNYDGDLDGLLGIDSNILEATADIKLAETKNLLPKTLAYFDSFSYNLLPLITPYFGMRLDYHYLNNPLIDTLPGKLSDTKLVYFEIVERHISNLLTYNLNVFDDDLKVLEDKQLVQSLDIAYTGDKTDIKLNDTFHQPGVNNTELYVSKGNDSQIIWTFPAVDLKYIRLDLARVSSREPVQIFWASAETEGKFTEAGSRTITVVPGKDNYIIEFGKELKGVTKFRFDIGNRANIEVNLRSIEFYK